MLAHCSKGRDEAHSPTSANFRKQPLYILISLWWDYYYNDTTFACKSEKADGEHWLLDTAKITEKQTPLQVSQNM